MNKGIFPLESRYGKVWENGVIRSMAVQVAIGINGDSRHQVRAVEMANRESTGSRKDFLLKLKQRGLSGVEWVVSDDHAGRKKAIGEVLSEAACVVTCAFSKTRRPAAQSRRLPQ